MKKVIFGAAIILTLLFGGDGVRVGATSDLVDNNYDFEYLISEIIPSETGNGSFVVKNNSTEYETNKITLYAYRLGDDLNPYEILVPSLLNDRQDFYVASQIPAYESDGAKVNVLSGLTVGEEVDIEFYFSVMVALNERQNIWIGTRKVSYAGCAEMVQYRDGVTCKLREQVGGVLYYDAYVDGVMVDGTGDDLPEDVSGNGVVDDNLDDEGGVTEGEFGFGEDYIEEGTKMNSDREAIPTIPNSGIGSVGKAVGDGDMVAHSRSWLIWLMTVGWFLLVFWRRMKESRFTLSFYVFLTTFRNFIVDSLLFIR